MADHAWRWVFENKAGEPVPVEADFEGQRFPTEKEAEAWVGEVFNDLIGQGVDQVTLYEDERLAYGPMSLHPDH